MNYLSFQVSISTGTSLKFIDVVAVDMSAAHSDIRETYGQDVEIVGTVLL
jgi:hypothetical protein